MMSALLQLARPVDFDRLYRHHAASVYRYAFAVLGNHADAEDVTQQTFLNAYRAIAQGTKPRKPENWLLRIAHNEVRRHFRSAQSRPREVELDERLSHDAPERSEPSLTDVLRALQQLPLVQRSALVMREFEGRPYAEIAELLNMTPSALEGQIFRARRALAEHLEGAFTCAEAEDALLRGLDGRLPRRIARRLKAHLQKCHGCAHFATVQKRQRSLLKGLSVMPIPASLFLYRPEQAAAAGLGAGAVAAGGSAAAGGGVATGIVAKAAAVSAAAAVAGGVGYGVTANPDIVAPDRAVPRTAMAAEARSEQTTPPSSRSVVVGRAAPARARPATPVRKARKPKAEREKAAARPTKTEQHAAKNPWKQAAPPVKARPAKAVTKKPAAAPKGPARGSAGKKTGHVRPAHPKPAKAKPVEAEAKAKPEPAHRNPARVLPPHPAPEPKEKQR